MRAVDDDAPLTMREFELIRQLRMTLNLFDGAMPVSPKLAWEEALRKAGRLQRFYDSLMGTIAGSGL